jgi:hypothetical protein
MPPRYTREIVALYREGVNERNPLARLTRIRRFYMLFRESESPASKWKEKVRLEKAQVRSEGPFHHAGC